MMNYSSEHYPLFSIVTPSFNQGMFIRETIESVLNQDYPAIEYWVIDGGSTDETISILREYENNPCFNWISEPDEGQAHAINKGLGLCSGDIFNWLGSDDLFAPETFQRVAEVWRAIKEPAILYGLARHIDEDGNDLGFYPTQSQHLSLRKLLKLGKTLAQPATFSPREVVAQVGGVNQQLDYAMDLDLWLRIARLIPLRHIPEVLAFYRLHSDSKTVSSPLAFSKEIGQILADAAQRGDISPREANARTHLHTGRMLLYRKRDFVNGIRQLTQAAAIYPGIFPEILLTLVKRATRTFLGEKGWERGRALYERSRFTQNS